MVQKKEQTVAAVTGKDPLAFSSNNIPDTDVGVDAPGGNCSSSSGEATNNVLVALQMKFVVWTLIHVLLQNSALTNVAVNR